MRLCPVFADPVTYGYYAHLKENPYSSLKRTY